MKYDKSKKATRPARLKAVQPRIMAGNFTFLRSILKTWPRHCGFQAARVSGPTSFIGVNSSCGNDSG